MGMSSKIGLKKNAMEGNASELPDHVRAMRDGLLNFDDFLGLEAITLKRSLQCTNKSDDQLSDIPISAYKVQPKEVSWRGREFHWMMEKEFINDVKALHNEAQKVSNREGTSGTKWNRILDAIRRRIEMANIHPGLGPIDFAQEAAWDTDLDPYEPLDSSPSPDLYFGFPVQKNHKKPSKGFENDEAFKNFDNDTLSELCKRGLRYSPLCDEASCHPAILGKETKQLCFPWCVMQLGCSKDNAGQTSEGDASLDVSWRTSMAASGSLSMLEKLARFAEIKEAGQHVPPVVVFTSKESEVNVGLAFTEIVDDQNRDHNLVHIWHGDVKKFWDAIQYCRILDNMFFWSQHMLRPRISHYIDQWRHRYCFKPCGLQVLLEKDVQTAEIVRRTQDRLSAINLNSSTDLSQLIQQAIILQEATRAPTIILKETSTNTGPSSEFLMKENTSPTSNSADANQDASFTPAHLFNLSPLRMNFDKTSLLNTTLGSKEHTNSSATLASEAIDIAEDESHPLEPFFKLARNIYSREDVPLNKYKIYGEAKRNTREESPSKYLRTSVTNKTKESKTSASSKTRPKLIPLSRLPVNSSNQQREIFSWAINKKEQEKQGIRWAHGGTLPGKNSSMLPVHIKKEVLLDRPPFMIQEPKRNNIERSSRQMASLMASRYGLPLWMQRVGTTQPPRPHARLENMVRRTSSPMNPLYDTVIGISKPPRITVVSSSEPANPFTLEKFDFRCEFERVDPITREVLEYPLDIKMKVPLQKYGGQSKIISVKLPPVIRIRPWNF